MRAVRNGFGFGRGRGGCRIGLVIVVGKHGCWPPEDYFALGSRHAAPVFSRKDSLLIPCLGLVQGGSPQSGYLGHRCCGRRKRCNHARILAARTLCQSICSSRKGPQFCSSFNNFRARAFMAAVPARKLSSGVRRPDPRRPPSPPSPSTPPLLPQTFPLL